MHSTALQLLPGKCTAYRSALLSSKFERKYTSEMGRTIRAHANTVPVISTPSHEGGIDDNPTSNTRPLRRTSFTLHYQWQRYYASIAPKIQHSRNEPCRHPFVSWICNLCSKFKKQRRSCPEKGRCGAEQNKQRAARGRNDGRDVANRQ